MSANPLQPVIDHVLDVAGGRAWRVPSIGEQLGELIRPGRAVAFRTESGSLYELTIYSHGEARLTKFEGERGMPREIARGKAIGAHDRKRGVWGIVVQQPDGRQASTSAVVKAWLSYDAVVGQSYNEPD